MGACWRLQSTTDRRTDLLKFSRSNILQTRLRNELLLGYCEFSVQCSFETKSCVMNLLYLMGTMPKIFFTVSDVKKHYTESHILTSGEIHVIQEIIFCAVSWTATLSSSRRALLKELSAYRSKEVRRNFRIKNSNSTPMGDPLNSVKFFKYDTPDDSSMIRSRN
jgi:hypothetical protein